MKINKVAPYEGELAWLGEMRSGTSQRGTDWQSVDFAIRYSDGQKDKHILFNAFGADKVGMLMATPMNTRLRVTWEPDARESNGRWWGKNADIEISVVDEIKESPGTQLPDGAVLHPRTQAPTFPDATDITDDEDSGLPF